MTEARKRLLDAIVAVLGLAVASMGIWFYFDEADRRAEAEARREALAIVNAYNAPDLQEVEVSLYGFWRRASGFVNIASQDGLTARELSGFAAVAVSADEDGALRRALLTIARIYERVHVCRDAGICDAAVLDDHFCERARATWRTYQPFFAVLNREIGVTRIGAGLGAYSDDCIAGG